MHRKCAIFSLVYPSCIKQLIAHPLIFTLILFLRGRLNADILERLLLTLDTSITFTVGRSFGFFAASWSAFILSIVPSSASVGGR